MPIRLAELKESRDRSGGDVSLENPTIKAYQFGKASTDWLADCVPVFEEMATHANRRLFREERHLEATT